MIWITLHVDLRIAALLEATAATNRGYQGHLLVFRCIFLISFRWRDVFLRGHEWR